MVLYLDVVIAINFIVNYCFFYLLMFVYQEFINYKKLILVSFVSCIFLLAFFFNYYLFCLIKVIGGIILVIVAFGFNKLLIRSSLFYLIEFSFTGIIDSYSIKGWYLLLALFIVIGLVIVQNFKKQCIIINNLKYNVCIKTKELKSYTAYLDTGNLATIDNIPIIFLKEKYFNATYKYYGKVSIGGINGKQHYCCYRAKAFSIEVENKKVEKDVVIVFTQLDKDIDCLLNYHLFC